LSTFNELLETYGKHKAYADKAREQASSFSSSVIEKVIADHQIKASLVADDIAPLVPQITAELERIEALKGDAEQSKGDFGARIEELELRKLIGEITDDEFNDMTAEGRDTVQAADSELDTLNASLNELKGALDKWLELSGASIEVEQSSTVVVDSDDDDDDEVDAVVDSILPGFEDPEGDEGDESVEVEEESVAFDFDEGDAEESIDIVPESEDGDAPASVQVEVEEADINVEDSNVDEIGVDPSEDASGSDDGEADPDDAEAGGPRRAILLSNEGTPEEQIYALTGEVFTIGRGRDNDLQIKNDSKVSRFHCKLYRRGANFYLEDNKSSNGTMVNGELISERRLFGGEELVIGETFFRFRVM